MIIVEDEKENVDNDEERRSCAGRTNKAT